MGLLAFLPLLLIFYFMLIRPQQKRMKEHTRLIAALEVGDDVLLSSGIYGTVTQIDREMLEVEVADDVELRVARNAVSEIVDYDTDDVDLTDDDVGDGGLTDADSLGDEA
jgi:preprotein translocase subunit YajC